MGASSPHHPRGRRRNYFPKDSLVEIRTDEEDFKGALFLATVILPAPTPSKKGRLKKSTKLYVEYHNLLAYVGGSERLREYVDVAFVRPAPPLQEIAEGFEPDDVVDAFYKDAWWTGVVTRVEEGGEKFIVSFQHPPDELEFGLSELRVHWDWVNGSWVRPEKQCVVGSMFEVGRKVEVYFDREDCQIAWFPAIIRKDLGNGGFLVEYFSANDDNQARSVEVTIDSLHVRPCPPLLKDKKFSLLENVDAFFEFGWWGGVIVEVLENGRYIVLFKQMKRDMEFNQPELRPHMEWKDGKWFASSHENHPTENSDASLGTAPVKNSRNALSQRKLKEGNIVGARQQITDDNPSMSPVSVNNIASSDMQAAADNPSWGKKTRRKLKNADATQNVGEKVNSTSNSMKKSSTIVLQLESSKHDVGGKGPDTVGVRNTTDVQNERAKEKVELPNVVGLPCVEMGSSEFGTRGKRRRFSDSKESMRGRSRKVLIESIQTPGNAQNGVVGSDDSNKKNDGPRSVPEVDLMEIDASFPNQEKMALNEGKIMTGWSDPKNRKGRTKRNLAKMHACKVVIESIRLRQNGVLKRGRRKISSEKIALPVQNSLDASGGKMMEVNSTVEGEKGVGEAPINESDDEPLSKWIERMCSPSIIDGSKSSPVSTLEQRMENDEKQRDASVLEGDIEKQPESLMQDSALVDKGSIVPSETQSLPFLKNTVLWKTIESMEVFQRIPQRPHFRPLEHFKESSREGLAIGCMVTFSSVVEKASRLRANDPTSITDDILETLADLERHGFDVRVVQDRVTEFLVMKDKHEKLVNEVNELRNQISEHNREKSRIEDEMLETKEHIRKLQEKLSLAESAKEKEDDEIAALRGRLRETEESIKRKRREFEGIASSLF